MLIKPVRKAATPAKAIDKAGMAKYKLLKKDSPPRWPEKHIR